MLRPFFSYYGSKWNLAKKYPQSNKHKIIEPFAGSAGYSLRFPHKKVLLYDLDPVICGLWDYLINVTENEILQLEENIIHVDDHNLTPEQKTLIGFWISRGNSHPAKKTSTWFCNQRSDHRNNYWGQGAKQRIASQLKHIRHWKIQCCSYKEIDNQDAIWFIDPPYQAYNKGKKYRFSNRKIDYEHLGQWCKNREGEIIVCEDIDATWLPFKEIHKSKSTRQKINTEAMYTNIRNQHSLFV